MTIGWKKVVLGVFVAGFLFSIFGTFFSVVFATNGYNFEIEPPTGIETFQDLVRVIGRWIFRIAIPIAVIMIIWAGVLMLTSGGKPEQFRKGMSALKYAVIGLAIILIGQGFVTLIKSILDLRN